MKLDVTTQRGYLIAVALNGPGVSELDAMKKLITGEVRRVCGMQPYIGGATVRNAPDAYMSVNIEAVRNCIRWLCEEVKTHNYLQQVALHWLSHAGRALVELRCNRYSWFFLFVEALCGLVDRPHNQRRLNRVMSFLDEFTEEGSRIGGRE